MLDLGEWSVAGSYFEACNCEAICPCRVQDGRGGAQSSSGECVFVLSWRIDDGRAADIDFSGLEVVLAGRYFDDEDVAEGRPLGVWDVVLFIDSRASVPQAAALEMIFLGRAGGSTLTNFAAAIGDVRAVRRADIRLDHRRGRQRIDAGHAVTVRAREPVPSAAMITCAIPGHDRPGEEWVTDLMRVNDAGLAWEVTGKCGFAADFSYRSG